jgi:hypothetical protein
MLPTTQQEAVMATVPTARRELAHRVIHGIELSLVWDEDADTIALLIPAPSRDEDVELDVPRDCALDAFHRPEAYLAASQAVAVEPAPRRWFSLFGRRDRKPRPLGGGSCQPC